MREILFGYKLNPITWAYISSLMMIGVYFKFRRFWSVRNLDLIGLICYTPGLLLIYYGLQKEIPDTVRAGYVWLFVVNAIFLIRLLIDPLMVRRPLLDPNLSASGLTFTGAALLVFLLANVITATTSSSSRPVPLSETIVCPKCSNEIQTSSSIERLEAVLARQQAFAQSTSNPGYFFFHQFAGGPSETPLPTPKPSPGSGHHVTLVHEASTRIAVILAHLAVVAGMVWIGYRHFENIHTGVAAAILYLLSFYTSQFTGQVDHIVPAMFLVWAIAAYRRPIAAGILLGLAGGMIYYPLFLLPLWFSFYWRRGLVRFLCGVLLALSVLICCMALASQDFSSFLEQLQQMFGLRNPYHTSLSGFWQYYESASAFRISVLAAFVALSAGLALWPARKNFGTLLSCSAAVMLASQFWIARLGGLYMAWFLPLLILTMFRPNLEDRVAISAVRDIWIPWRRKTS
jgi:hypothetical protein